MKKRVVAKAQKRRKRNRDRIGKKCWILTDDGWKREFGTSKELSAKLLRRRAIKRAEEARMLNSVVKVVPKET